METIGSKRSYALIWCTLNNDDDDISSSSPLFHCNFGGVPIAPDPLPTLGSASAWTLSYLAMKLFSKNSNLCDHGT